MNAARTFNSRIMELAKKGYTPAQLIPILEVLEDTLLGFQEDTMADKDIPVDEKGRLAMILTPMIRTMKEAKNSCSVLTQKASQPQQTRLHNAQLQ